MSVMLFSQSKIMGMSEGVKLRQELKSIILYSKPYRRYKLLDMQFNKDGVFVSEESQAAIIERLFWYCWQANKIAYVLNYPDEKDNVKIGEWDEDLKPKDFHISDQQLLDDLSHFRYNLFTNDGNIFLADEWLEALDSIIGSLKDRIIKNTSKLLQSHL